MTAKKSGALPDKRRKYDEASKAQYLRLAAESRRPQAAARQPGISGPIGAPAGSKRNPWPVAVWRDRCSRKVVSQAVGWDVRETMLKDFASEAVRRPATRVLVIEKH